MGRNVIQLIAICNFQNDKIPAMDPFNIKSESFLYSVNVLLEVLPSVMFY